jgi:hypothetical protein
MRCVAIPWIDPGGVQRPTDGIHIAWTGPELIEVSLDTYRVERRQRQPPDWDCDPHDSAALETLRAQFEIVTRFGPLLYRLAPPFRPIALDVLRTPDPGGGPQPVQPRGRTESHPAQGSALEAFGAGLVAPGTPPNEAFTQELQSPVNQVRVTGAATIAFAVALSDGKALDVHWTASSTFDLTLQGAHIDTVVVYVIGCTQLQFCVPIPELKIPWHPLAGNLALPVVLDSTNQWVISKSVARSRLLPGESLSDDDLDRLGDLLRLGLVTPEDGAPRPGSRILLMRNSVDEPFEEVSFTQALELLRLPPWWRRALGFAYSDLEAHQPAGLSLNLGSIYEYRVIGTFGVEDLNDTIYDFHAVPGGTRLPAAFHIRDLSINCAETPRVVLDPPPPPTALREVARRGLSIEPQTHNDWLLPSLGVASLVINLPRPVKAVTLEVGADHHFTQMDIGTVQPLPSGPTVPLTFSDPITRIVLGGTGTLFAVRIPAGQTGSVEQSAESGQVRYEASFLPSPQQFHIRNLQTPPVIMSGPVDESTPVPPRHRIGFTLEWIPATERNIDWWLSDLDGDPPTDALAYQIEHQRIDQASPWEPLQEDENLIFATNDAPSKPPVLAYGADLDEVFAAPHPRPPDAPFALHFTDIFPSDTPPPRAPAPPRSTHQYRIRAIDLVGRVSDPWTVSNIEKLRKFVPPPVPPGPDVPTSEIVTDDQGQPLMQRTAPSGAYARVIVAGPELSAEEQAIIGTHDSAVVLNWGWGANERSLDPFVSEFRIYTLAKAPDFVPGTITNVTPRNGWTLAFTTDRVLEKNECVGQWITSNGHPFLIVFHEGGSNITIGVEASKLKDGPAPAVGPASFGRSVTAELLRPARWDARVAVVPIDARDTYQHVLFDLLHPSATRPLDSVWVGVSAADSEPYVADEIPASAPNGGRDGNEGGIAACTVNARYTGRPPSYSRPDPLGDVPEIRAEEPTGRQVIVFLDLPPILNDFLPDALQPREPVVLDRCSVETLLTITSLAAGDIGMRRSDGSTQTIVFPNSDDQQHVINILGGNQRTSLETRYLLYLATHFDRRDEIFERIGDGIDRFGVVEDYLSPKPQRCFYRVRRADEAGHVSLDGTILPCVVRVPSAAPAKTPEKVRAMYHPPIAGSQNDGSGALEVELRAAADPQITHLLVFSEITPRSIKPVHGPGELLRVPNRPDLYPAGIRLRSPNGTLLAPVIKSLADADITIGTDGWKYAIVDLPVSSPGWMRFWCAALTADGIPSPPVGPFTVGVGGS